MSIERIVDELDVNQRNGIFQVPSSIEKRKGIKNLLKNNAVETPFVVIDETYYRAGIEAKLRASRGVVINSLCRSGLIRPKESEDFLYS